MPAYSTYWRTLRDLKASQFYWRAFFLLYRPRPDLGMAPARRVRCSESRWERPTEKKQSLLYQQVFRFLNEEHDLSLIGWDNSAVGKLWRYNLHYFDYLNAANAEEFALSHYELLSRWMNDNSPGIGVGWEPYPTSLRIVNWIKWELSGHTLPPDCIQSLAVQVRWLLKKLEYHLLGNHLFSNAKALIYAGLFFQGQESEAWIDMGLKILSREIGEQFTGDGGHFERSPMYHALALEDLLDLINIRLSFPHSLPAHQEALFAELPGYACRAILFLQAITHPDGEVSYFNDSVASIAPKCKQLELYAERLDLSLTAVIEGLKKFPHTGYVRIKDHDLDAILDVGPIGPDYLPGHAHADSLSFELSFRGERIFVNSGISTYENGSKRKWQRSTAAHNTMTIDNCDSSEVWSSFRVGRKAKTLGLRYIESNKSVAVRCEHDGYRWIASGLRHAREWRFQKDKLTIFDSVNCSGRKAIVRLYLHPHLLIKSCEEIYEGERVILRAKLSNQLFHVVIRGGKTRIVPSEWYPEFGLSLANSCLETTLSGMELKTELLWVAGQ